MNDPKLQKLIEDKYAPFFEGYNFGTKEYSKIILEGLEKVVCGYWNGLSLQNILLEMKFTELRSEGNVTVLTKAGLDELVMLRMAEIKDAEITELNNHIEKLKLHIPTMSEESAEYRAHKWQEAAHAEREQTNKFWQQIQKRDEMIARLENILKSFDVARVMAGPEDAESYIHNHEIIHRDLKQTLSDLAKFREVRNE